MVWMCSGGRPGAAVGGRGAAWGAPATRRPRWPAGRRREENMVYCVRGVAKTGKQTGETGGGKIIVWVPILSHNSGRTAGGG